MGDASSTLDLTEHIAPNSDHLTAESFLGGPRILTISEAGPTGQTGKGSRPVRIRFVGEDLPFLPSLTCRRLLSRIWGKDDAKSAHRTYPGRLLRLYREPSVSYGGEAVGGIRIDGASHISGVMVVSLPESQHKRRKWRVEPLEQPQARQSQGPTFTQAVEALGLTVADVDDWHMAEHGISIRDQNADRRGVLEYLGTDEGKRAVTDFINSTSNQEG